jgi:hypothetical protein
MKHQTRKPIKIRKLTEKEKLAARVLAIEEILISMMANDEGLFKYSDKLPKSFKDKMKRG